MFSAELTTRERDGQAVVALRGELDVMEAASLAAALVAVVARAPRIVADLAALDFIDSSGAAALVLARREARRGGGDLLLAAPREQVLRFLNASGLIDVFPVLASADQAAVGCAGRSPRPATTDPAAVIRMLRGNCPACHPPPPLVTSMRQSPQLRPAPLRAVRNPRDRYNRIHTAGRKRQPSARPPRRAQA